LDKIDKYVDHLPLYRQQQRFARENINIPYSTITDWVTGACKLILPLYDALQKEVLRSDYLHADETPIKVLDKDKKGQTHRGYFWLYHISLLDLVLFDYQQGRGREGPSGMLKDFSGHLQTDGYSKKRRPKKCAAKQKIATPKHIPVPIRRTTSTVRILAQLGRLDMVKRCMIPKPENKKKIKRKLR
jgi:hypothetical protein